MTHRDQKMDRVWEKPRDRGREIEPDSYNRTRERERLPATRGKDGEVDLRERERRRDEDRRPNGRASLAEAGYGDLEIGERKGDTFPRMTRPNKDREGRGPLPVHEKEHRMGRPKEMLYETERERERRRYREMESERERTRYKEYLRRKDMKKPAKEEAERRREREKHYDSRTKDRRRESYPGVSDHWDIREREREKEKERFRQRDREGRCNPRESESFSDREWRVERHRETDRNRKRDTKSEGDSDGEREKERRRKDDSKIEHRHYKSEGDSEIQQMTDRIRERDRYRDREAERRRDVRMQREKETGYQDPKGEGLEKYRDPERQRDRMKDSKDKRRDYLDRDAYLYATERRRYKEEDRTRCLEQAEIEKEKRRRENRETGRRENRETERRENRAGKTSGSDVEIDPRREKRENEAREREIPSDIKKVERVKERREEEQEGRSALGETGDGETAVVKETNSKTKRLRKMWLEPRTRNERNNSSLEEEYLEREKARERYNQRYRESKASRDVDNPERDKRETMSLEDRCRELEKAGEFMQDVVIERVEEGIACETMEPEWQMERENVAGNVEELDREERRGNSRYGNLENEDGSDDESEGEKERMMSTDDGFVTVSSGGDDAEEDDFEDCKEFWDGGDDDLSGQSKCNQNFGNQGEINVTNVNDPSKQHGYTEENIERAMDELTLSHTKDKDRYDIEGEGRGSYDQPTQDVRLLEDHMIPLNERSDKDMQPFTTEPLETSGLGNDNGTAATETSYENPLQGENEGTEDDTWYTSEEGKQCSTAPHYQWTKSVVKEILSSDITTDKDKMASVTHIEMQTNTQTEGERAMDDWQEQEELLEVEEGQQGEVESESDEGSENDLLDPSSVQYMLSSEGEAENEGRELVNEKTGKIKEVVLSSSSFRDLGNEARIRRRGFRKTTEKQKEGEEEGVGRDRRTRIFNISDEDDDELSISWSELDLRKVTESLCRTKKRNSKFFNTQLYQEYSEVVQNREILLSHSDSIAISGDSAIRPSSSPNHSPKPSHRPLPPPPPVPLHPYTLSQNNSFKSLAVPQRSINRPPSPRVSISLSSPTLWQDLPGVRSSFEIKELTEDERRLQEVRFEVVTSEASYCHSLDIVVENFVLSKELNTLLTSQDKNWLFSRLYDVRAVSHSFLSQLEERVESDVMHFTVCDLIIKHCPRFRKVYVPYLTNQSYQDKTFQRLMDGNHEFRRVVEKLERNPVCQRLPLRSFLILPFQRITRLKLLVQNIVKRTAPKTKDEAQAIKAMKLLEKMIQDSNESISQMKNIESLVSLNAKVDFECRTLPLISQSRRLVREGPVTELRDFSLKETERNVYMHLFNDYLLLSLRKEGGKFTVIDHAPVLELRVENCRFKLHSLKKNLFRLHMVNQAVLLRTETQADKLRWISALSQPYPEIDFTTVQDFQQVQCIRAYVAQQPDELNLEKADVLLVHQESTDGWVEGTRLSDRQRGWAPDSHLETIVSDKTKKRNLLDTMKIATAAM